MKKIYEYMKHIKYEKNIYLYIDYNIKYSKMFISLLQSLILLKSWNCFIYLCRPFTIIHKKNVN